MAMWMGVGMGMRMGMVTVMVVVIQVVMVEVIQVVKLLLKVVSQSPLLNFLHARSAPVKLGFNSV